MYKKNAFLFPGQGSQYPGMGKDFFDAFSIARETFEEADDCLSQKFSKLIFEGPSEELTLTKNSQLAIYVTSVAIWKTVLHQFPDLKPNVCAGLSLGEYTALTASSRISFEECLPLVQARGKYMNEACEKNLGTMFVILGLEAPLVEALISEINPPHDVWVANINCPGQVVISGSNEGVQHAIAFLKEKGAKRALPLEVSGAFHSGLMSHAQQKLEPLIASAALSESSVGIVMNVQGGYVSSLETTRRSMIEQVTHPVRWEQGIRAMEAQGVDLYLELGCGKTLLGMNKRIGVVAPTLAIEKIEDLEGLSKLRDASNATIER